VDVLHSLEDLVEEVLDVLVREVVLRVDDLVQVGLHEVEHDVDVDERLILRRRDEIAQADDILVLEVPEHLDLAQDALRVDQIVERVDDLLDRDLAVRDLIQRRADDTVGTATERLERRVLDIDAKEIAAERSHQSESQAGRTAITASEQPAALGTDRNLHALTMKECMTPFFSVVGALIWFFDT
jgi:hypothetical protein